FPLTVGEKQKVFKTIVEWHSPDFQTAAGEFTLVFLVLALFVLVRRGATWIDVLPAVGFVALGLVAQRNLPLAAVVLAPALGRAMSSSQAGAPTRAPKPDSRVNMGVLAVMLIAVVVFTAGIYHSAALTLRKYPVAAADL